MRIGCVVQSRMGNTRLPGKNGRILFSKPQIWHVLSRIQRATSFSEIMLAIPHESNGGIQIEAAQELGIPVLDYHGNPNDLVHRYALAADIMDFDIVVRIPGDNTFTDPEEIDRIVNHYRSDPAPWNVLTTNLDRDVLDNGYPAGLGAEVYDARYLEWLDKQQIPAHQREHPHKWAFENQKVRTIQAPPHVRNPGVSFSVDTEEDWEFTKDIYKALYPSNPDFRIRDIMLYLGETNGKRSNFESACVRYGGSDCSRNQPDSHQQDSLGGL